MMTIGIDPHKTTLTAVGLSPDGTILGSIRLPVNAATLPSEQFTFAANWPQRRWAVEGAACLGLGMRNGWWLTAGQWHSSERMNRR